MPVEEKSLLLQLEDVYLQNLIGLVPAAQRQRALEITEQFRQASRALSSMTPSLNRERYATIQYVIDAIKLYLSDTDKPALEDEIVDGLIGRGFRSLHPGRARGDIKKSLAAYTIGQAREKPEIRLVGQLYGLAEWGPERYGVKELPSVAPWKPKKKRGRQG